jgi:hypothetical protein
MNHISPDLVPFAGTWSVMGYAASAPARWVERLCRRILGVRVVLAYTPDEPGTQVGLRLLVEYPRVNKHTRFHRMQ